jgi:hypothetical protein
MFNKEVSMTQIRPTLSIAAVLAASVLALQAPVAGAADNTAADKGVPGVEANVGQNASDRGVPGVEMNIGRDGDQKNVGRTTDTRELGASGDTQGMATGSETRPRRADRN